MLRFCSIAFLFLSVLAFAQAEESNPSSKKPIQTKPALEESTKKSDSKADRPEALTDAKELKKKKIKKTKTKRRKKSKAQRLELTADILRNPRSRIQRMQLEEKAAIIRKLYLNNEVKVFVELKGTYKPKDTGLARPGKRIPLRRGGKFRVRIRINKSVTTYPLIEVSPRGFVKREYITIRLPNYEDVADPSISPESFEDQTYFAFTPSLGVTWNGYSEPGSPDFGQVSLTAKFSLGFGFNENWDIGFNSFVTVVPLFRTDDTISFRVLGINGRIGFFIPGFTGAWALKIMAGFYYNTTLASQDLASGRTITFGYKNVYGPQLFPVLVYRMSNNSALASYLKFSPLMSGFGFISIGSFEFASGISYTFPHDFDSIPFSLTFDYARLNLDTSEGSFTSSSFTLGVASRF